MVVPLVALVGLITGGVGIGVGLGIGGIIALIKGRKSSKDSKPENSGGGAHSEEAKSSKGSSRLPPSPSNDCSICMELLKPPLLLLPCLHMFHQKCCWKWFQKSLITEDHMKCPNCREVITAEQEEFYLGQLDQMYSIDDDEDDEIEEEGMDDLLELTQCGRCKKGLVQPFDRLLCGHAYHRMCLRKTLWTSFLLQNNMCCEVCEEQLPAKVMSEYLPMFFNDVGHYINVSKLMGLLKNLFCSSNTVTCCSCNEIINDDVFITECDHYFHQHCFYQAGWLCLVENERFQCPSKNCTQYWSQPQFFAKFAVGFLPYLELSSDSSSSSSSNSESEPNDQADPEVCKEKDQASDPVVEAGRGSDLMAGSSQVSDLITESDNESDRIIGSIGRSRSDLITGGISGSESDPIIGAIGRSDSIAEAIGGSDSIAGAIGGSDSIAGAIGGSDHIAEFSSDLISGVTRKSDQNVTLQQKNKTIQSKNTKIDKHVLVDLINDLIGLQGGNENFETHSICPICEKKMEINAQIELECDHVVHRYCFWKPFLESLRNGLSVVCPLSACMTKISDEMVNILMIQMQEDFSSAQEAAEGKSNLSSQLMNFKM